MKTFVFTGWPRITNSLIPVGATFLFLASSVFLINYHWSDLPPKVPLWFTKAWGEERLADPLWLWLLPSSNLAFLFANLSLAMLLRGEDLLAKIVIWFNLPISLVLFFTLYKILLVAS